MKNKIKVAFLSLLMLLLLTLSASASGRATLFIDDGEWEDDSLLPFIETEGKMLLPASSFASIDAISITRSDTLGSLLFERGDRFLSYNLNFGTALDENGVVKEANIYRYGGEIYIEPYPICEKFDLKFETAFAPDGYLAARITSGNENSSFQALLDAYSEVDKAALPYLYNPTGKTVAGSFMHPVLLVPTFANMAVVLDMNNSHRLTFALSPSDVIAYAKIIPQIYAKGHTLVYYMDVSTDTDTDAFRAAMEAANRTLFALCGKSCRVYVSVEAPEQIPKIDGYFAKSCSIHLVVDDLRNNSMINFALYDSPNRGVFNFSLASDKQTRSYYTYFFNQFDRFEALRSMPITEASAVK